MPKKIRWGRVTAALSLVVALPLTLAVALVATFEPVGGPSPLLERFERNRDTLHSCRDQLDSQPDVALARSVAVLRDGAGLQRGTLVEAAVGTAMVDQAAEVIQLALQSEGLESGARARNRALANLQPIADERIDPVQIAKSEVESFQTIRSELLWSGQLIPMAGFMWHQRSWEDLGEQAAVSGYGGKRIELRGRLEHPVDKMFVDILIDADASRSRVAGLVWMAQLVDYRAEHGRCPDTLRELGPTTTTAPFTYDAERCEVAITVHPEQPPMVVRGR